MQQPGGRQVLPLQSGSSMLQPQSQPSPVPYQYGSQVQPGAQAGPQPLPISATHAASHVTLQQSGSLGQTHS